MNIAIIGGSLSGLSAAIEGAKNNPQARIVVLEQKDNIADFYGGEILPVLHGLEIPKAALYAADNFVFYVRNKHVIPLPENTIWMTDRAKLQKYLEQEAVKRGVNVIMSTEGNIQQLSEAYDYVIDASGYRSATYKSFNFGRIYNLALAIFYIVRGDFTEYKRDLHMWWLEDIRGKPNGYFWIFPKANGKAANVGVGWLIEYEGRYFKAAMFSDLDNYIKKFSPSTWKTMEIIKRGGHILPMKPLERLKYGNILLVGDAAGLMNATLGAGNHLAMISGQIAGRCCALGKADRYEKELMSVIGNELWCSQKLFNLQQRLSFDQFEHYFPALRSVGPDVFFKKSVLFKMIAKVMLRSIIRR